MLAGIINKNQKHITSQLSTPRKNNLNVSDFAETFARRDKFTIWIKKNASRVKTAKE